jgi:hypothetical protein
MRSIHLLCLLLLAASLSAKAQVLPSSNGTCSISPSGLEGCEWLSAVTGGPDTKRLSEKPRLLVTRYTLAPGAPLKKAAEEHNKLVVGLSSGDLANESKSPRTHIVVTTGSVMLMQKKETYLLRNIGPQSLQLLLIEIRK